MLFLTNLILSYNCHFPIFTLFCPLQKHGIEVSLYFFVNMKQEQNEYHPKHGINTGYLNLHFTEFGQCNESAEFVITRI